jgi:hypothetical protein
MCCPLRPWQGQFQEASPVKVSCCSLVASTDLEKALDKAKEETRGAGAPLATMGGRPTNIDP